MVKNKKQPPQVQPSLRRRPVRPKPRPRRYSRMMQDANGEVDLSGLLHKFINELQNLNSSVNELREVSNRTRNNSLNDLHEDEPMVEQSPPVRRPRRPPQPKQKQQQKPRPLPVKRLQKRAKPIQQPKCMRCHEPMTLMPDGTYSTAQNRSAVTIHTESDLDVVATTSGSTLSFKSSDEASSVPSAASVNSDSSQGKANSTKGGATPSHSRKSVSRKNSKVSVTNPNPAVQNTDMAEVMLTESQLSTILTRDPPYNFQDTLDAFIYMHADPQFDDDENLNNMYHYHDDDDDDDSEN